MQAVILVAVPCVVICELFLATAREVQAQPMVEVAPMDLHWDANNEVDENGFPVNPRWGWQLVHNKPGDPAPFPDPARICDGFPYRVPNDPSKGVLFGNPGCVTQNTYIDYPYGFHDFICSNFGGEEGKLHGHVNWVPAHYEGLLFWKGFTPWYKLGDGDYNFWIIPTNYGGLTAANPEGLSLEFDSHETVNYFTSRWWDAFRKAVDTGAPDELVRRKFAIIIGLMDIDTEHEDHSELHPVYAMAIHKSEKNDPKDDVWEIFVRNWGNEGYCSQNQQYLQLTQMKILLPAPQGWSRPTVTSMTDMQTSSLSLTWSMAPVAKGALLSFNLGDWNQKPRVNGELHLRWTVKNVIGANPIGRSQEDLLRSTIAVVARPVEREESTETERSLNQLFKTLPAEKQAEIEQRLKQISPQPPPDREKARRIRSTSPKSPFDRFELLVQPPPALPPSVKGVLDPEKIKRDKQQDRVICDEILRDRGFAPQIPLDICAKFVNSSKDGK